MKNINGFHQNLFQKYIELKKNYLILKSQIEEKNQPEQNYKTELCKKFQTTGKCPYGHKCRFAHGKNELISKAQGANYKKEKCKSFYEKGYCPYGSRCKFQHDEREFRDINFSFLYLRLFIFKYFGFFKLKDEYYAKSNILCNKRLKVFESLTQNSNTIQNIIHLSDDLNDILKLNISDLNGDYFINDSNNSNGYQIYFNNEPCFKNSNDKHINNFDVNKFI